MEGMTSLHGNQGIPTERHMLKAMSLAAQQATAEL